MLWPSDAPLRFPSPAATFAPSITSLTLNTKSALSDCGLCAGLAPNVRTGSIMSTERCADLRGGLDRRVETTKKTLSDHSIAAHITQLHRLSCQRFPGSHALWDAALAHALASTSPLLVSSTLSACIALHPTHVRYWVLASRWESEGDRKGMGGGNVEAARRLCMRGLRFLPAGDERALDLWREWIRLEVAYVEKLKSRQEILGLGKRAAVVEAPLAPTEADVQVPLLPDELPPPLESPAALSGADAVLDGAIIRVVLAQCLAGKQDCSPPFLFVSLRLIEGLY